MMTITLGLWLIPAAITVASAIYALSPARRHHPSDITPLIAFAGVVIVNLSAWLIWALLT